MSLAASVHSDLCSNLNLLDNWYFIDPVSQRGGTTFTNSADDLKYGPIDRWQVSHSSVTVNSGYITLSSSSSGTLSQKIDNDLFNKNLTFSILLSDGTFGSGTTSMTYNKNWFYKTVYVNELVELYFQEWVAQPMSLLNAGIRVQSAGNPLNIVATKLELGTQQTLAHKDTDGIWVLNDPPPNKALELLKCQRYYRVYATSNARPSKALDCSPVMRVNPTQITININGATYYVNDANL